MLAIRNLLRVTPQVSRNVVQQRSMSAISTPARNKVSKGELLFLSAAMVIGWTAIPAWVLVNIKNYRSKD
ncbi:hypothetical protein JYU34_007964 [Plutella xylostella]|uniref:Uncharacterized protein n=2 Tax=Plutella xylostella TaxID=51655 RepID=A0ABQ7QNG7_PLUXY|nr:hypothetical protein JYU34_007964 [Plutella xylostella]CAG9119969.1 unnamed protein product [Plutella xylostella]